MRILLIEDNPEITELIRQGLSEESFAVDAVHNGEDGLRIIAVDKYDLIILDIILPGIDGFEVCRILRERQIPTPILILSAKHQVSDRVNGLNSGADDYLTKPFAMSELTARIRALLRREKQIIPSKLQAGPLVMNTISREVTFHKERLNLTRKEHAILEYLMRHPNMIITRTTLENHVWVQEYAATSNLLDVNIKRIRDKLGKDGEHLIQTVWGVGYQLVAK